MSSLKSRIPQFVKSIVYSEHLAEDPTKVLKLHKYPLSSIFQENKNILLKSIAFPVNPSDINQLQGVYPSKPEKTLKYNTDTPSAIAGNEGLFEIVSLPSSVPHDQFKVGDWVIPLQANFGTWSTYRACDSPSELIKMNGLDKFSAATFSVNSCTAYLLVNRYIKDWNPGQDWLITNAGTSQVSKIVTQICSSLGIKTLSVIRDRDNFDEVANELKTKYGATEVISESQNNDKAFGKEKLPQLLKNGKIRLALNSVGGSSATAIARKLPKDGIMVTYGGMSMKPVSLPTSLLIFKNIQCLGFWITQITKEHPEEKQACVKHLLPMYQKGEIISPKDDLRLMEWDVDNMKDEQVLQMFKDAIQIKGKKNFISLKH